MKSPFPGMDPYIEGVWGDFHTRLTTYLADALNPVLPGDLRARLQERVYIENPGGEARQFEPDVHVVQRRRKEPASGGVAVAEAPASVTTDMAIATFSFDLPEVTERYIDIIDIRSGGRVVTSFEVLSPTNKTPGEGRRLYLKKQRDCREAGVNLVELDLIRFGQPSTAATASSEYLLPAEQRATYHASIMDLTGYGRVHYYPIPLRSRLPKLPIPLREQDTAVPLDLQAVFEQAYERGYYAQDLDYDAPLDPPAPEDQTAWIKQQIAAWRAS